MPEAMVSSDEQEFVDRKELLATTVMMGFQVSPENKE